MTCSYFNLPCALGRSSGNTNNSFHTNYVFADLYQGRSNTTVLMSIRMIIAAKIACLPSCSRDYQSMFGLEFHLAERTEPCCLARQTQYRSNDVQYGEWPGIILMLERDSLCRARCSTDICFPVKGPWSSTTEYSAHSPSPKIVSPCFHLSEFEYTTSPKTEERIASPASIGAV